MKKKATYEDFEKMIKILEEHKVTKPYYIEVEKPKVRTDFLMKNIGTNKSTIIDKFKDVSVKPTLNIKGD